MNKSDVWREVGIYGKQERTELSAIAFLGGNISKIKAKIKPHMMDDQRRP